LKRRKNNKLTGLTINNIEQIDDYNYEINFHVSKKVEDLFKKVYGLEKLNNNQFIEKIGNLIFEYVKKNLNEKS
jgi:hypothetical protein